MTFRIMLFATIAAPCLAADPQMEGPKLGFVYDQRAAAVRPILGIPGASVFGLPLAPKLQQAVVSPSQEFAVVVSGDDYSVGIFDFSSNAVRPLKGARLAPTKIVFSPNGAAVALLHGSTVQVFSSLAADPDPGIEYDLAAEPTALAISDDGALILAATVESDETVLYSYNRDGAMQRILRGGQIVAVEFLNHSHDAVFADALANKVFLLKAGADSTAIASIDRPTALAAAPGNHKILATSGAGRTITVISLDDGTSVSTSCGCEPNTLARLQGGSIFRVTAVADGPTWIFDSGGSDPKVLFIPRSGDGNE